MVKQRGFATAYAQSFPAMSALGKTVWPVRVDTSRPITSLSRPGPDVHELRWSANSGRWTARQRSTETGRSSPQSALASRCRRS